MKYMTYYLLIRQKCGHTIELLRNWYQLECGYQENGERQHNNRGEIWQNEDISQNRQWIVRIFDLNKAMQEFCRICNYRKTLTSVQMAFRPGKSKLGTFLRNDLVTYTNDQISVQCRLRHDQSRTFLKSSGSMIKIWLTVILMFFLEN